MSRVAHTRGRSGPPGRGITVLGQLMALWCLGFAAVNIIFEITDHFADGPYAAYASGLAAANWLVVVLKVIGAAVALLSVAKRPTLVPPALVTVVVWAAFSTLGVYTLGNVVETVGMVTGLSGSTDQIALMNIGYVLFFLLGATGYGVLAISYSRRHGLRTGLAVLGVLGGPAVLALVLLAVPMLLTALGLMPAY